MFVVLVARTEAVMDGWRRVARKTLGQKFKLRSAAAKNASSR